MLFSYQLFELVKHLLPVSSKLRSEIRAEIVLEGKKPTLTTINERLLNTKDLMIKFALSMLDHVVLELAGYCFSKAFQGDWLSPKIYSKCRTFPILKHFHEYYEISNDLTKESILSLNYNLIKSDPSLIAIRLAVQGVEAALAKPEYSESFKSSERKSLFVQSEGMIKAYIDMIDKYDDYFENGNFTEWWTDKSPVKYIKSMILSR